MTSTKDSKETKEVAEKDVTYNAYAATKKGGTLEPFKYHPRILGTNDVEIKISHCGICGSDIHTIDSGWGPSTYPVIVGHEIIGVVTKAGGNCKLLKVGDRVGVGAQVFACHKNDCHDCMHDDDPHCPKKVFTYDDRYPDGELTRGGYAEFVRVHEDFAFKIPDALSSAEAAPLMCAGATVWQPMVDHNVKWGSKVAGKPDKGTYRAHIYQQSTDTWYEMQDLHVWTTETMPQLVALSEAYIQIFERKS